MAEREAVVWEAERAGLVLLCLLEDSSFEIQFLGAPTGQLVLVLN